MEYPPCLSDDHLDALISDIKDWQLNHGSLLRLVNMEEVYMLLARPVGISLFPTLFPRDLFHQARQLQKTFNRLYVAVAEDEEWLRSTLKDLVESDILARTLWEIFEQVKQEGYVQDLTLGIFRSDYMLHMDMPNEPRGSGRPQLKQVEFNTFSCAGGAHGNRIADMHRYLVHTGAYAISPIQSSNSNQITSPELPPNHTTKTIAQGLATAHRAYGAAKSHGAVKTCILFIVQPRNYNTADERPIEYGLWESDPPIPSYRVIFGQDLLEHTSLTPSRELLYHPPSWPASASPMEASVVYMRAGYGIAEYDDIGKMARLRLEISRAIKAPSLLSHITTFKKVQQALSVPGVLERFLSPEEAAIVSKAFAPLYPMDESSEGKRARRLALDMETAKDYVLKPSLEGGGHNVYGDHIPEFLAQVPYESWHTYILMKKISPPAINGMLLSSEGIYSGRVTSELGVFGVCLWKRRAARGNSLPDEGKSLPLSPEIIEDLEPTWSFKTKDARVNEMSVVKGYGCFDSPVLVDRDLFLSFCNKPEQDDSGSE